METGCTLHCADTSRFESHHVELCLPTSDRSTLRPFYKIPYIYIYIYIYSYAYVSMCIYIYIYTCVTYSRDMESVSGDRVWRTCYDVARSPLFGSKYAQAILQDTIYI